jgi:hypothetical protein
MEKRVHLGIIYRLSEEQGVSLKSNESVAKTKSE